MQMSHSMAAAAMPSPMRQECAVQWTGDVVDSSTTVVLARYAERDRDMRNRIFYFTGSGNSLAIARSLAAGLGETEVLPIAKSLEGFAGTTEERVGIVSPVYSWGPPRMVAEFLKRLRTEPSQYVFALSHCASTYGATLRRIGRSLRSSGSRLNAGFVVRHDIHVLQPGDDEIWVIRLAKRLNKVVPRAFSERQDELLHAITSKVDHEIEVRNWTSAAFGQLMHPGAMLGFKRQGEGFTANDACVSCGICTRVCPRKNIYLVDGRPTWRQDCEACNACILWCPKTAIRLRGHAPTEPRHHPAVKLPDMLLWPDVLTAST